jgi:hypothetical protein
MVGYHNEILENEWYLVRHSGETPEIALHAALYYITRAKDGPKLTLGEDEIDMLRNAAVERFSEIVRRDLQHVHYGTPAYRGLGRSIINYRRFCIFCKRQQITPDKVRSQAAQALQIFLTTEMAEVSSGKRPTIINCSHQELQEFAEELGVDLESNFSGISVLCLPCE